MASLRRFTALNVGLATAYLATGRLGLELAGYANSVTLVWPPAGIALAALALYGRNLWPGIALGAFGANLLTTTPTVALGIAVGNTLAALVGLAVLERLAVEPSLRRARDVAGLFAAAAVFPLVSASVGVASLRLGAVLPPEQVPGAFVWWWIGDGVGILLVAPALLTWLSPRPRSLARRSRLEGLALSALLATTSAGVFLSELPGEPVFYPVAFAVVPLIAWASARFGPRGAALAGPATAAIAIVGTLGQLGPFGVYPLQERLLFLELFVAVLGGMALLLGSEVAERDRAFESLEASLVERARAERELAQSEQRFRLLSDHALEFISEIDGEGNVVYVSPNLEAVLGHSAQSLSNPGLRAALEVFVHPDDLPGLLEQARRATAHRGTRFSTTFRARHRSGAWLWLETHAHSFEAPDGTLHLVSVNRDVSERVRAEEEARRLTEQILQSQKLESLGVLAGGVAHDFNNLLAGILANTNSVTSALPPDSPLQPALHDLETLGLRAAELTHQMLAYAGGGPLVTRVVDLSELVNEMNVLVAASVSKKARLSFDLARGLAPIECDVTQIRQVVMNLITNASEALGDGEGSVVVSTRLGGPGPDGTELVELEVRDTGCGMDAETRARMFDPFFTTKFTGRGLGLAATLGIVRTHRATLDVETAVGKGTVVRLRFPPSALRAVEADAPARKEWRPEGTILLVEDEDGLRIAAGRALTGAGFTVLSAANGREALGIFRERAPDIRAVLLDLTMPDLSGAEVLPALRAARADVPVVVWSGYSEVEIAARLHGEKPDGLLLKPSTLKELLVGLRDAIEKRAV